MQGLRRLLASALLVVTVTAASLPLKDSFTIHQSLTRRARPKGTDGLARAYARYRAPVSEALEQAVLAQQGTVSAVPTPFDVEYVIPITIGGQQFKIDLDTGSSDLWVYATAIPVSEGRNNHSIYDPTKSSTSRLLSDLSYSTTYGDGSYSAGQVYSDKVTVGGVSVDAQVFGAANNVSSGFTVDGAIDGFFGLGMDTGNQIKPTPQKTFFSNARASLAEPLFTAYLNHAGPGSYDFGFISPAKRSTYITWAPALTTPGKAWWGVTSTGYAVAANRTLTSRLLHTIIDSGDSYLMLPPDICDDYYSNAPTAVNDPALGYVFPCKDTLPDIKLYIGSYIAHVPGWLLNGGPVDGTRCSSYLQPIPQRTGIPNAVFGDIFLKTTFTIFKWPVDGKPELGFVPKPISGI